MSYNFRLHKLGTLLVSAVLMLAAFTTVFALQEGETSPAEPMETTSKHVFLPLVQNEATALVNQVDAPFTDQAVADVSAAALGQTRIITFSGLQWSVKRGNGLGPGAPGVGNNWSDSSNNVWVGSTGDLHLKITNVNGQWYCAEIVSNQSFGFGQFQWKVISRLDQLDPNGVLGLFTYPTANVGPDGTNEIDIEFARWGASSNAAGNYTVYPAVLPPPLIYPKYTTHPFAFTLPGDHTTQRFTWRSNNIFFQSLNGHTDTNKNEYANWTFAPATPLQDIPQAAVPVHINLWLYRSLPPTNGQPVEVVIRQFKYTP